MVAEALREALDWGPERLEIVPITTTGDVVQDRPLAEVGGKGLWTKELDRALIEGRTDMSVHSMKDVETFRPDELVIAAMLPRADVRDRLIGAESIAAIPTGATVGTSSPRRRAQMLRLRPDLRVVPIRGNVDTRLAKLAAGEVDATLLAAAGLDRLDRPAVGAAIPTDVLLPAPAQGAVGVEVRADDPQAAALVAAIDHADTHRCVAAERALLAGLGADCHSPVAALASLAGETLRLRASLIAEDGTDEICGAVEGTGPEVGTELATDLLDRAPPAIRRLFAA